MSSTLTNVVNDLLNVGTVSSQDIATAQLGSIITNGTTIFDANTGTILSEGVWQFNARTNVNTRFTADTTAGDPAGSIEYQTYNNNTHTYSPAVTMQVLTWDGSNVLLGLEIPGSPGQYNGYYQVSDSSLNPHGTTVTFPIADLGTIAAYTPPAMACYVEGTRIRTARGDVPVEELVEDDMLAVCSRNGATHQPVVWIGRRRVNLAAHPDPETAFPIRIRRNAFASGQPSRDLLVSPDHAIYLGGLLIPAKLLVNGGNIIQERDWTSVVYFHVELPEHAVIFAEDLPAESYLDTGNRAVFEDVGGLMMLHPDFSVSARLQRREDGTCAPFVVDPAVVRPIWHQLALRSRQSGYPVALPAATSDPNLRLRTGTGDLRPFAVAEDTWLFVLPRDAQDVRLVSLAARPGETQPWIDDVRQLGVRIGRITVKRGLELTEVALDSAALGEGWWAVETEDTAMARWTNGDAHLVLPSGGGIGRVLALQLAGSMSYPVAPADDGLLTRKTG